ncbi:MAG: OmpH/Skp family outer membrane protein [Planctomycetota bacterium]|jgi:Skp family chaperone for outer membrane proteins
MTKHRSTFAFLALGAVVVATAYQAGARRPMAPEPPVVAAVRIQPLFDGLLERAEAKTEVDALENEIRAEQSRRQASITTLEEQREQASGAGKRKEFQEQIDLELLKMRFWLQEAASELESEKAIRLQYLYRSIKTAIRALAEAEGYDLVILDDSIELPNFDRDARVAPQVQVLGQITNTKVLHLNATLDITEDLIIRMNNEHRAAQGGP